MSKEYNEEVRLQSLKEFVDEYANEEELTSVYGVRATIDIIEEQLNNYKKLLNANPSEALECLEWLSSSLIGKYKLFYEEGNINEKEYKESIDCIKDDYTTIKQALLKAQEPKKYLKWEDLEFDEDGQETLVLLNDTKYRMYYYKGYDECINLFTEDEISVIHIFEGCSPQDKQFFNDLHLERVEE